MALIQSASSVVTSRSNARVKQLRAAFATAGWIEADPLGLKGTSKNSELRDFLRI